MKAIAIISDNNAKIKIPLERMFRRFLLRISSGSLLPGIIKDLNFSNICTSP